MKKKVNNMKRDQDRRMVNIKKKVNESWTKSQNPNMFGGCPVVDNTGKMISVEISTFVFVAEFFESEEIQTRLIEAFKKKTWSLQARRTKIWMMMV